MKKFFSAILIATLLTSVIYAQDEVADGWKKGGMSAINFSQVSLTNWAAGGENSFSGNLILNGFANMKKGKMTWDNTLSFGYGLLKQGDKSTRKSDDKLELASKLGKYAFKSWYYSGLLNFKTQVSPGFEYADDPANDIMISDFLAPGYLNIAIGMDYKPNDNFTAMISPVSGKITMVIDTIFSVANGLDAGATSRSEFGAYAKVVFKKEIMENIGFQTKLDLFSNYIDNPQNIDVNWEVILTMKINKYVNANLSTSLLYDDDIKILNNEGIAAARTQFKEVFGVGFTFSF